jgi:hypothetical protein
MNTQLPSVLMSAERMADLAAASRILAARGVVDGFGHVSMRHPDNPLGSHNDEERSEVRYVL